MSRMTDHEKLRKDLTDNFGAAMSIGFGAAAAELASIERSSADELIEIARNNKIDLSRYEVKGRSGSSK